MIECRDKILVNGCFECSVVASINDVYRSMLSYKIFSEGDSVFIQSGMRPSYDEMNEILNLIENYKFNSDDSDLRDSGIVDWKGEEIFWAFEYSSYDEDNLDVDPSNIKTTQRNLVLYFHSLH